MINRVPATPLTSQDHPSAAAVLGYAVSLARPKGVFPARLLGGQEPSMTTITLTEVAGGGT